MSANPTQSSPFCELPVFQQASLYAWYVNLSRAERKRVDALDDEAFEAEYGASKERLA